MEQEEILNTEALVFAAINNLDIQDIDVPDTEEARNLLRMLKAEIKQARKRGTIVNIPV